MNLYFTDIFDVTEEQLEEHGAFNISLVVDLPLFIDPFLLFDSPKPVYKEQHERIINYLRFLRDLAQKEKLSSPRKKHLYCFKEVTQNWLGFSQGGNSGRGLGMSFANALSENLSKLFADFGKEKITAGSHLEKLCLIRAGVGRDMISDFTTNLIKGFLCEYTQAFALAHIDESKRKVFSVQHARFSEVAERWAPERYTLPEYNGDYVLLTPKDILTKDDTWINKEDYFREYHDIPEAIGNQELRAQIDAYFRKVLPKNPDQKERKEAAWKTTLQFPDLIDYFIKHKEDNGDEARRSSIDKVGVSHEVYVRLVRELIDLLQSTTAFYQQPLASLDAAREKAHYLKDVIENKGGHKIFYDKGKLFRRESDLQILYGLTWHGTLFNVSKEVNDGRGPVDFEVSMGAADKTLVEMKLASNSALERNLKKQVEVYKKASSAKHAIKVIIFFTAQEKAKVQRVLKSLGIDKSKDIVLIDARDDNKPSGSKA